ncbi:uncharacterized protein LOC115728830 [Rhodamnia argentea]|uniref:Uncharacterized protein LOC115728830 n=1 Tax=Rhodamnia argentea TaxID=178133 RepID=A0A8B8MYA0_9MYRT|nr:uncharacterized protein LOC115728830 [Rhodamnia argentea]
MEMPVMNRLSDFEAGISSLQDPSFLSQFLSFSVRTIAQAYSFWKWGALILALVASFGTIINRIRFLVIKYQNDLVSASPAQSQRFLRSCIDRSEEDDACSSSSCSASSSEMEEDEIELIEDPSRNHEVFVVKGSTSAQRDGVSSNVRRRRSFFCDHLSGFCDRTNVVKLWNIGLEIGLDPEGESPSSFGDAISITDLNTGQRLSSFSSATSGIPAISAAPLQSQAAILSSGVGSSGNMALRVWDTRTGPRAPSIIAEWAPRSPANIERVNCGGPEKLFLEAGGELMLGDMRNVSSPLKSVTESDVETWWDADAVIVSDELVSESRAERF